MTVAKNRHPLTALGRLILRIVLPVIWVATAAGCSEDNTETVPYRIYSKGDTLIYMSGDSVVTKMINGDNINMVYNSSSRDSSIQTKDRQALIISLVLAAIIASTVLIILTIRKNHKINNLAISIDKQNHQTENMSEIVSGMMKDKVSVIQTLSDAHTGFSKNEKSLSNLDRMENLQKKVTEYENRMSEIKNKENLYSEIEKTVNTIHGGLMSKLRGAFNDTLNEEDFNIIACILSGMSTQSISFLTGISPGTLRTRKSRYKEKISALENAAWKETVLELFSGK
ncbi:MAG: hypothetical protein IJV54_01865 [Bacteroidales bacterium]|nr:hypothetical protein [Bacteroidales bacterium]